MPGSVASDLLGLLQHAQIVERSHLAAAPTVVWERIASMPGVNAELMPAAYMTFPRGRDRLDRRDIVPGQPLFRSVLLLFCVLPIDIHTLALVSLSRDRGFLESSSSLLHRRWVHERTLEPERGGTTLPDRVYFDCRVAALGAALAPVLRAIFRHRHARLRQHFGESTSVSPRG